MKLLYCIPALHNAGGMERVLTEKVNFLAQLPNYEIFILTTDHMGRSIRFTLDDCIHVIHLDIDFESHFNINLFKKYYLHKKKIILYRRKLVELIAKFEIDICVSLCGKEIEFLSKMNVNCKRIAEIHFAMNIRKQFLVARHRGFIWKVLGEIRTSQLIQAVKGLDKLVVLTKADKDQWERKCSNVIQIMNPTPFVNAAFSKLKNNTVITVGRLDPQKGYDMLIDAWVLVADKHPNWVLNIFGHGELELVLKNKIDDFHIGDKIKLCGLTTDVVTEYLKSSIFVMSSRYEGLPMVLIEAMSCGLPVVSFDCECGPREIITDGVDGYLVEPNNVKSLADHICSLIENNQLRVNFGKCALEKSKVFSIDKIMQQWINLFEN